MTAHLPQTVAPPSPQTPAAGPSLRPVRPDDGPAVHALLVARIPGIPEDRGRWLRRYHWQYWENPFRKDLPAGWVLEAAGRVVGHLGAVCAPCRAGTHQRLAMIAADYAVAPDAVAAGGTFAGLRLATAFFDAAAHAGCLPLATTANEKTEAVFTRFGCHPVPWTREFWRAPTSLAQQVRSCRGADSRTARAAFSLPGGSLLARLAGTLCRAARHQPRLPLPHDCRIETTTPRLARDLPRLWQRAADGLPQNPDALLIPELTGEYLDWRYARHPERAGIRVLVVRLLDGPAAGAAVVFCEDRGPQRIAFVEELMTLPGRTDVARALLCAALQLAARARADWLVTPTGRRDLRPLYWELAFQARARAAPAAVVLPPYPSTRPADLAAGLQLWHGCMC